jgi:hypothetical protein
MAIVLDGTNGISTPDVESAGPISGTTGTFSGAVQVSGLATNLYPLVSATAVASTSGTSIDFTSIPSWVKRITVMLNGVSTNGTSPMIVQLGDSGGVETTGYAGNGANGANAAVSFTTGFPAVIAIPAASTAMGLVTIATLGSNIWAGNTVMGTTGSSNPQYGGASKTLSDTLTQVRITTVNGTDTFDAGSINIMYE